MDVWNDSAEILLARAGLAEDGMTQAPEDRESAA
jgi:hypothetical protein